MKKQKMILICLGVFFFLSSSVLVAQDNDEENESKYSFSVGADLVSRYVWRGLDFGNAPAVQPGFAFTTGGLEIGAWGSYSLSSNTGGLEADLYASYSFDFGLGLVVTDYYFPGEALMLSDSDGMIIPMRFGNYFDFENAHTFEFGATYGIGGLSLGAYYMATDDGDLYFEAGYGFSLFDVFIGAGNGAYTVEDEGEEDTFGIINLGLSTSKEIKISESFSLPMFGSIILNTNSEQIHFVVGVSL
jgi:hypothetical protein